MQAPFTSSSRPPSEVVAALSPVILQQLWQRLLPLAQPPASLAWNRAQLPKAVLNKTPLRRAAVLIGLRRLPQPRLILTLRTLSLQAHAGQVAFPGGREDPSDQDPLATALRETAEEIGLPAAAVKPCGYLECFETLSGYLITPVVAWVDPAAACVAQPDEVAEIFEVPLDFLLDPQNLKQQSFEWGGQTQRLVEYNYQSYRIWGATAAILYRWLGPQPVASARSTCTETPHA